LPLLFNFRTFEKFDCPRCAACSNSGVLPLGPDTYRIAVTRCAGLACGGSAAAHRKAIGEAQEYCAKQGKQFLVIGTNQGGGVYAGSVSADVQVDFRCLNPGDPGLVRPTLEPVPDVVIQDRRR
jgi:hypothetical protein